MRTISCTHGRHATVHPQVYPVMIVVLIHSGQDYWLHVGYAPPFGNNHDQQLRGQIFMPGVRVFVKWSLALGVEHCLPRWKFLKFKLDIFIHWLKCIRDILGS